MNHSDENNSMEARTKWIIYGVSCVISAMILHVYSLQVFNYKTSAFAGLLIIFPSLVGAYFFKELEIGSNQKEWIFGTLTGLLITLWPTWGIVLFLKYLFEVIG